MPSTVRAVLRLRQCRHFSFSSSHVSAFFRMQCQQQQQQQPQQQRHGFASMAAPVQAASSSYIPGRADPVGTANYAKRIGVAAGVGHFRALKLGGEVGDLIVSSIGHGTYLGSDNDAEDRDYVEALTRSLTLGINVIDCASNYRNMRSEMAVGQCLTRAIKQGLIKRNEVVVCTKGGFLTFDYREDIEPRTYIDDTYVKTGLFQLNEFVGGCHCLSAPYLKNQLDLSRRNFNLDTIDVYFVHNPEIQLAVVPRQTVLNRVKNAFAGLEECVKAGKISAYGVATWSAFRTNTSHKNYMPLEDLVYFAKEVGGDDHHFKVVQLPYNVRLQEAATLATQSVRGKRMPLLHAAHQLGLSVIGSSSLNQANYTKYLPADFKAKCTELGGQATDAQYSLQFARTTPGITTSLVGMRQVRHVEENSGIIRFPANPRQ